MLNRSGIYAITHINGRRYIGSAINLRVRWTWHRNALDANRHHSRKLQRAWNKYGREEFTFSVLEYVEDKTKLIEREQQYLSAPGSIRESFNNCPVAGSTLGKGHSKATREKMSRLATGRTASPETKRKMSIARKGRKLGPMSEHTKMRLSESKKGHLVSSATRKKMSDAKKGRKLSTVHAAKLKLICQMMTKRSMTEECRKKMSASAKERVKKSIRDKNGRIIAFGAERGVTWSDPAIVPLEAYA